MALTLGTRTPDAQSIGAMAQGAPATAGYPITPGYVDLMDQRGWEHPFILVNNEGFILTATVAATGTWTFSVDVGWAELPNGQY